MPLHRSGTGTWSGRDATTRRPDGGVVLRGRIEYAWSGGADVRYGIESFYVHQGTARRYDDAISARRLYADVVVGHDGRARLAKLVIR